MKLSTQAMDFFEYLATNAHHRYSINELLVNQPTEIKEICLSNSSEYLKNHFTTTNYFADSVKVAEI